MAEELVRATVNHNVAPGTSALSSAATGTVAVPTMFLTVIAQKKFAARGILHRVPTTTTTTTTTMTTTT